MTRLRPQPTLTPPAWPHCGHSAHPESDPLGCRGVHVPGHHTCLAHLSDSDRAAYLDTLVPGANLDHRGTAFTEELLIELLTSLVEGATGRPRVGDATFELASFSGAAVFDDMKFDGHISFKGAEIAGDAQFNAVEVLGDLQFEGVTVGSRVSFEQARIHGDAWFGRAAIDGAAVFGGVNFGGDASFLNARFRGGAWFGGAAFQGEVWFAGAEFSADAVFRKVAFERMGSLGPLVSTGTLDLSEARFGAAVTIEAAAVAVDCRRTRWASTAALRLRYAVVDLSDAVLEYPVSIAARARPFITSGGQVPEDGLADARARVASLRGVDATHLVLTDLDLSDCLFSGTINLDRLRLEGLYTLASVPTGLHRRGLRVMRWTPRRTLAEEHHWRATRFADADGWTPPPPGTDVLAPAALAPVYRQLRKSFEDGKHEPGAADFYYGEMEMRRHADDIPWTERSLLTAYWAVSGYGLRASRALACLLTAMTATVLAMMLWGIPKYAPVPTSEGTLRGARNVTVTTAMPTPVNPDGPYLDRLSTDRFEKSLRVVINSAVFRSSGQDLTTVGTYVEMASRLTESALLGLAILALRNRVRR